ncbi:ITPK1 [Branchiostoma lanceolatum]|uniref:ITPK1 protein n=1 Tax=Branchiostoma lanceolatum TaxID=7740 RepID=A0A8K0ERB0_BRALA|nr:ITPK1 [Branchiostoma lanceolatum]
MDGDSRKAVGTQGHAASLGEDATSSWRVGCWLSEKKKKTFSIHTFSQYCRCRGMELVLIDSSRPLAAQGPFHAILHKLTDVIIKAQEGDTRAQGQLQQVEDYLSSHPEVLVVDPLSSVKSLMDRWTAYHIIQECIPKDKGEGIFMPEFVEIQTADRAEILQLLQDGGVHFPFVCKRSVAQGSASHEMAIIFNAEGLKDLLSPPCVAQNFVNHNAVLHKVFVVGESYFVVERPSLKNFSAGDQSTIYFNSHDVSKAGSSSFLNQLDSRDKVSCPSLPLCREKFEHVLTKLRQQLGITLFGVDIIVENRTSRHAIIDINAFPSYDGVPDPFSVVADHLQSLLSQHCGVSRASVNANTCQCQPNRAEVSVPDSVGPNKDSMTVRTESANSSLIMLTNGTDYNNGSGFDSSKMTNGETLAPPRIDGVGLTEIVSRKDVPYTKFGKGQEVYLGGLANGNGPACVTTSADEDQCCKQLTNGEKLGFVRLAKV